MKDRNPGEWIRIKDHLCPCFKTVADGPIMYQPSDNYFCFRSMRNPWARNHATRYAVLAVQFSANSYEEWARLKVVHAREAKSGNLFQPPQLRYELSAMRQDIPPEGFAEIYRWLDTNMVDGIDHRLYGDIKTPEDWKKKEQELLEKYASFKWTHVAGQPPTRWQNLHSYTNTMEAVHRADLLFVEKRPQWIAQRAKGRSSAVSGVEAVTPARADLD